VKGVGDSVVLRWFIFGFGLFVVGHESLFVELFQKLRVVDCEDLDGQVFVYAWRVDFSLNILWM
jgi:hypothetical protein